MKSRLAAIAALSLLTWGATMGAAEARDPTPLPAEYPETGPTTTTIPVVGTYPTVPPTTTTVPVTTTTVEPASATTTVPPTTTAAPRPTPEPTPEVIDEEETEPDAPATEVIDGRLPDESVAIYETGAEGSPTIVSLTRSDVETYLLIAGPDGVELGTAGTLRWTPSEAAGGSTAVMQVTGMRDDGSVVRYTIRVLVAEVNEAPNIVAPSPLRGFPGKSLQLDFTADDPDEPTNSMRWRVQGPAGMSIDDGTVQWDVPEDTEPGTIRFNLSVTDDGEPARTTRATIEIEIVDTSDAAVAAVDADGHPVNPMVIAAAENAAPLMVDLDEPGALMTAMVERTPKGASRPLPSSLISNSGGPIESSVIVESVQETLSVLLELDVPTTAVAGGLVWQFALLVAPSLFSRRRGLFDIVGLEPNREIGDSTFRFRSDATGLPAGALRRKDGQWVRAVRSPRGPVWIPNANLRRAEGAG